MDHDVLRMREFDTRLIRSPIRVSAYTLLEEPLISRCLALCLSLPQVVALIFALINEYKFVTIAACSVKASYNPTTIREYAEDYHLKNPKSRNSKKSAQASRTITRQSALKDINRGLDNLNLVTSNLAAHEIPDLKLDLPEAEVFELSDADTANDDAEFESASERSLKDATDASCKKAEKESADDEKKAESARLDAQRQSSSRMTLPPKPFTIISSFRK